MTETPTADAETIATPTLAIQQLFSTVEVDPGQKPPYFPLATVQAYAGGGAAFNAPTADGYFATVESNPALFSVIGIAYGRGGPDTFAYPDLIDVVAVGGPPGEKGPGTLAMQYIIATEGGAPAPLPGMIALYAGDGGGLPQGWQLANGSALLVNEHKALFDVIGYSFGGAGPSFLLPNLIGAAPVGTGTGLNGPVTLGQQIQGQIQGLGLTFLIATQGLYPAPTPKGALPSADPFLGQIIPFAAGFAPPGWAECTGQMMSIAGNEALFELLGTRYGGNGTTEFGLPDLSGTMVVGSS